MPKFHLASLPSININNDYHIEIDNQSYNENEIYSNVKNIVFTNKYGSIKLNGFFDLSEKNIPSLIKINRFSFKLSKQLMNQCKYDFCKYKQEIEFNFNYEDIEKIKIFENKLKNEFNCNINYNEGKIYIIFYNIKNSINLNDILFNTKKEFNYIDDENYKMKNNENIQNEEDESYDMEVEKNKDNPFNLSFSDKTEDKKLDNISDINFIDNQKNNYIKVENIDDLQKDILKKNDGSNFTLHISNNKIKKEINRLISDGEKLSKENNKKNILFSINSNGQYILLNKDENNNNNYNLKINKIELNNDISKFNKNDNYKEIIFQGYISLLEKFLQGKKDLNFDEYTNLIISFINKIENGIIGKDNEVEIKRYKKIISTLKLFCILFLNCFIYKPNTKYINNPKLYTNAFSDQVMLLKKRLLIEWCIEQEKPNLEKKLSKLNINNLSELKTEYGKIYSFGQIQKSNIKNNKVSLFMRAKMANNNEKQVKNNMYLFTEYNSLYGEHNRKFNDIFIDKYDNDWISFLVQSLLYEEKRDQYIINSIELLSKNIKNMKDASKPIISVNNSFIYDINFILLKLYEQYLKGNIYKQIKYLKMLSYSCNINKNNSADHFLQYIICSILLKILNHIFQKEGNNSNINIDNTFIKKLTYNLLIKSVEEIILGNENFENYSLAFKLIKLSFINQKIKSQLINSILPKLYIPKDSLNYFEDYNPLSLTEKQKYHTLGKIYNTLCMWKNAYNCFMNSKDYKYALSACFNYAFENIKIYKDNTDFKEIFLRLNEIKNIMPELFVEKYQTIFLFIKYMCSNKNNLKEEDLSNLINVFFDKDFGKDLIDDSIKGIIIDLLYGLLQNIKNGSKTIGNYSFIEDKCVNLKTRNSVLYNSLFDIIKFENEIYS